MRTSRSCSRQYSRARSTTSGHGGPDLAAQQHVEAGMVVDPEPAGLFGQRVDALLGEQQGPAGARLTSPERPLGEHRRDQTEHER